jgi:hypothetical protein
MQPELRRASRLKHMGLPFDFVQDERQHGTCRSLCVRFFSAGARKNRTPIEMKYRSAEGKKAITYAVQTKNLLITS